MAVIGPEWFFSVPCSRFSGVGSGGAVTYPAPGSVNINVPSVLAFVGLRAFDGTTGAADAAFGFTNPDVIYLRAKITFNAIAGTATQVQLININLGSTSNGLSNGGIEMDCASGSAVVRARGSTSSDSVTVTNGQTLEVYLEYRVGQTGVDSFVMFNNDGIMRPFNAAGTSTTMGSLILAAGITSIGNSPNGTCDITFSDVALSHNWFDRGAVEYKLPTGAGNYSGWNDAGGTGTTFAEVDEEPPDDDTTYVRAGTGLSLVSTFDMATYTSSDSGGSVHDPGCVIGVMKGRSETAASGMGMRLRSGTTDVDRYGGSTLTSWSTDYRAYRGQAQRVDPADGADWTDTKVNAVEVGPLKSTTTVRYRCTQVMLLIWTCWAADPTGIAARAHAHYQNQGVV